MQGSILPYLEGLGKIFYRLVLVNFKIMVKEIMIYLSLWQARLDRVHILKLLKYKSLIMKENSAELFVILPMEGPWTPLTWLSKTRWRMLTNFPIILYRRHALSSCLIIDVMLDNPFLDISIIIKVLIYICPKFNNFMMLHTWFFRRLIRWVIGFICGASL